jgi:3'-phosphoadenosine 5'-phosphosulfate sulfotransferase (PAPS reductase)/FAD synthetase
MTDQLREAVQNSSTIIKSAITEFSPTHIVSMVSGGRDSACSHAVAEELGLKIDLIIHGNTRCGIPQTSQFVEDYYGRKQPELLIADAETAYEDYVLRKGFFGKGIGAHGFAYRILKATPFRKVVSKHIRQRRRDVRVLLLNGARKNESENRQKHLQVWRQDPAQKGNIWLNLIHNWTAEDRDAYLESRQVEINPVAVQLCRSGECMCGTMQSKAERLEAAAVYPEWGNWLNGLEAEARHLHGFGWGENFPRARDQRQIEMFQPMCKDCLLTAPMELQREE